MPAIVKKSFAESVSDMGAMKQNSDLQNLASAMLYAQQTEQEAKALQKRITKLATKIESGHIVGVDEVSALYREAQGLHSTERKRL